MSKSNVARMQLREPIAPTKVPEDVSAELEAIDAFIETAPDAVFLRHDCVQREAFCQLVMAPYESDDIQEACRRVAAVLDLLSRSRAEIIADAFQCATYEAGKGSGKARS